MKLGKKALEALQAEIDGRLMPGDELIVAGPVAAEGQAAGVFCRTFSRGCCKAS